MDRDVAMGIFMWKHIIIYQCTGGGMEIVKLPQASGGRGALPAHCKPPAQ